MQGCREAQRAHAAHRYAARAEGLRLLQEVALKAGESQRDATLEVFAALDVFRDQLEARGAELPCQAAKLVRRRVGDLQFDDIRHFQQARVAALR